MPAIAISKLHHPPRLLTLTHGCKLLQQVEQREAGIWLHKHLVIEQKHHHDLTEARFSRQYYTCMGLTKT